MSTSSAVSTRTSSGPERPRASIIVALPQGGGAGDVTLLSRLDVLRRNSGRHSFEIILVCSGTPGADADAVRDAFARVTVLRSEIALRGPAACNLAARRASGDYLVLLDALAAPEPAWLDWLIHTADANPAAGAVASCLLTRQGELQEAGAVLWRDGRLTPVGEGTPADALTWRHVRRSDIASGRSLLVRRAVWDRLGGYDETYWAGVYHDTDLCLRIRDLGLDVLIEPRSRVRVPGAEPDGTGLDGSARNRLRLALVRRWQARLQTCAPFEPAALRQAVHLARGYPRRILIVDDYLPDPSAGAGFGRMFDAVLALARAGYAVAHYPTKVVSQPADPLIDAGIAIVEGDLAAHLQRPDTFYDVLVVSRPHNMDYAWPAVRTAQPWAQLVYDCEALWWRRIARQADLAASPEIASSLRREAAEMQATEERNVRLSDIVVTVSEDERRFVGDLGVPPANVFALVPVERGVAPTSLGFDGRRDIGFVAGWMAGADSPNGDALRWFLAAVFPAIRSRVPWVRLRVTGRNPPPELLALSDPNVCFEGHVADLAAFYDSVRVAIAPIRFGSGVKLKTVQAIQHAVPIVATAIGAEGLTLSSSGGLHVSDDAERFAAAVLRLLLDEKAWRRSRAAMLSSVEAWSAADADTAWPRLVDELCARRVDGSGAAPARH